MSKKSKPNQLKKLLKAWSGAEPEERRAFLDLVAAETRATAAAGDLVALPAGLQEPAMVEEHGPTGETLIANGRYLLPSTIARMEAVMRRRRLTPSAVMGELGFSARDPSLARALAMKAALRLAVVKALEIWLSENEARSASPGGAGGEGEA
ncbi:hypothetical protein [Rhizobium sp. AAP43]|uniref:hypothetical protein n=1 Tax=Rhizobium sp. AAP43 TaxID=1523420 RepID=UPI0006B8BD31|nr:hypothetical protein [Rhizobium sp. AAP43]KPF47464.1 hypothetical protein IP76_01555 [Rhizobium sp. AAP43]